jgi:aminoglycoside phosphotransferase (APT) family kinase protein
LFKYTSQTDIHGDLTIDNLIIKNDRQWMMIDPNPTSVFKVGLMDWGKLLQSLHKAYETLARGANIECGPNYINLAFQRSDRYEQLYGVVMEELRLLYGKQGIKEALLHEIIHYLRLIPYKLKVEDQSGLLFFAVTCILIREFKEQYEIS